MLKRIVRDFCVIWACLLIVILPGCHLLGPLVAGKEADVAAFEKEMDAYKQKLDDLKSAVREADLNSDGKVGPQEALIGAGGILAAIWGRNKLSDRRKAKAEEALAETKKKVEILENSLSHFAKQPGATLPPVAS